MSSPIRQWLEKQGVAQYGDRFEAEDIDLDVLLSLSEQDLEKLGVSMGHRKKLLKAMTELGGAAGSEVAPSAMAVGRAAPRSGEQVEARKIISIIFADLMGSTALQERLDPESVNRVMDAYYQAVRGPVEAGGGTVVQLLGDGVLCAFGIPRIAEDDALRAVRAAVAIQQAFREFLHGQQWLTVPIGLRVAVNTGEVVVSDEHPAGIGDPLNVAARLQQEARDGEVLIGQSTRRLVVDAVTLERAGVFRLKGRAETVTAYRVLSLERPKGKMAAAFVGRGDELARISAVKVGACEAALDHALAAALARLAEHEHQEKPTHARSADR